MPPTEVQLVCLRLLHYMYAIQFSLVLSKCEVSTESISMCTLYVMRVTCPFRYQESKTPYSILMSYLNLVLFDKANAATQAETVRL